MKKSLFYWVFLVVAGISLAACSSGDDNIADNTTPATPDSQNKTVILTGTIGVGDNDETRAITNAGVSSWSPNDPITINYQTSSGYSRATGTIKTVDSDSHFATFEATLTDAMDDGYIGFAYGSVTANLTPGSAYDFVFSYSAYTTQNGATTGDNSISDKRLDYACTEIGGQIKMKVDGNTATLKGNAVLKNQFSMLKINLVDKDNTDNPVNATELKITIADGENFASPTTTYTITPDDPTNEFYVALQPKDDGDKVKIVASFNNQDPAIKLDATAAAAISSDDYGKFLCAYANDDNKQAYLCSSSSSPKICEYTYGTDTKFVKGKLYSKQLNVKSLTPTAVIAHVGAIKSEVAGYTSVNAYCEHFLALALEDVYSGTKTLADAGTELNKSTDNWVVNHKLKVGNITSSGVSNAAYDVVQDSRLDANAVIVNSYNSNTRTLSVYQGWRIPSVTDFRYIFQDLKTNRTTGDYVIDQNHITATTPVGIADQDAHYYSTQSIFKYGTSGDLLLFNYINNLCGNTNLIGTYYWISSQVKSRDTYDEDDQLIPGVVKTGKAWRFCFSNDQFEWNESGDQSLVRLVFAY